MERAILIKRREWESIENFTDFYYSLRMRFFASDLLYKGLTPQQISIAIIKAINIGKSSGMNIREHFKPVFSGINNEIISDCKLSRIGYGLVLMNAESQLSVVGKWQLKLLEEYSGKI
tara:strand:- start:317 stop:670 length:354 start_codon:yes stop_codon:yes gene_type:complete